MYLLYSLLLTLGLVILLPRFAVDALRAGKYVTGLRERLGHVGLENDRARPLIWLHCVSVGETEAAKPLVKALSERFPLHRLAISTTTVTGQQVARRAFPDAATIFYFPLDLTRIVRRVLRILRPSAVLIMETELWPNLLRECQRQSIPVALLNGRISENSFQRYLWIRGFMRRVLGNISVAIMQSQTDAERILELGIPADRVLTHGNIKFDGAELSNADASLADSFRDRFAFSPAQKITVAASTHDPEEAIVIEAFRRLIESKKVNSVRLIIAPRHPERFAEIARQIETSGLKWTRRSAAEADSDRFADVILLDSIGELRAVFALADVAFVGGSIAQRGGHNVLEPASQGVCTVTGPHMNNFTAITNALLEEDAIVQLPEVPLEDAGGVLASTLQDLLESGDRRRQIGARARTVCDRNRGATEKTIRTISHLLHRTDSAKQPIPLPALEATATK
jgi:3-deoxy-D-manno-octulosonic-acid transferase